MYFFMYLYVIMTYFNTYGNVGSDVISLHIKLTSSFASFDFFKRVTCKPFLCRSVKIFPVIPLLIGLIIAKALKVNNNSHYI